MHILVKKSIDSSNDVKQKCYMNFIRSAEIVKSVGFKKYYICPI